MDNVRVVFAFFALLVWVLLFIQKGIRSALAPLAAVCVTGLWFTLFGCLGILNLGGWLYYLLAIPAVVYLVWVIAIKKQNKIRFSCGFLFFLFFSLLAMVLLWARKPMFTTWDEFSFWGTAGKLTKLNNELYPTTDIGWIWPVTQTPVNIVISYFFQFFGKGFLEWQTYLAVDVLQFSALAACLAPFEKKHWHIAFPAGVALFVTPFLFAHYGQPHFISSVYLDSLGDLTMGLLFGGALAAYFASPRKGFMPRLPFYLAVAALTLTKDIGFIFALVGVALVIADSLFRKEEAPLALKDRLLPTLLEGGAGLAAVLVPFLGWSLYLQRALEVNRFNLGGKKDIGMLEMPLLFLQESFSANKSEKYVEVLQGMWERFFTASLTLLGPGVRVVGFILALVVLAALLTTNKAHRWRSILFGVFSSLGFIAYYLFIAMTYIYIFRPEQTFESYERYVYPYYIGWFMGAFALLGLSAVSSRWKVEGSGVILALALLFGFRFMQNIPLPYSMLGFNGDEYAFRREFAAEVEQLTSRLPLEGRIFIVSSGDDGSRWFTYSFQMLPWQADYSFGGGALIERSKQPDGTVKLHQLTVQEWEEYLLESKCTNVFLDDADEAFWQNYGALFADEGASYKQDGNQLYEVEIQQGGLTLVPMP